MSATTLPGPSPAVQELADFSRLLANIQHQLARFACPQVVDVRQLLVEAQQLLLDAQQAQEDGKVAEPLGPTTDGRADLKRIHRKLLEKAPVATAAMPLRALIRAAGYKYNSNSREAATFLCREGLLVRNPWNLYHRPTHRQA